MGTPSQSYGTSLAMVSHNVTCHPTQVIAPRLTPAMVLDLPTPEGWKAELTYSRLGSAPAGSRTRDLSITSPTPNRCTTETSIWCGFKASYLVVQTIHLIAATRANKTNKTLYWTRN